jgi:peptidylprolyl isomerase
VHYTGWLADGTKFDSSVDRGQPIEFPQGNRRVIPGWDTGFDGMRVGGKRRLYIPYQLAYGENRKGPIPAKANLIFDVELVAQRDPNAPPVQAAPATTPAPPKGPQ